MAEFRRLSGGATADRLLDEIKRSPEDGGLALSRLRAGLRMAFDLGA